MPHRMSHFNRKMLVTRTRTARIPSSTSREHSLPRVLFAAPLVATILLCGSTVHAGGDDPFADVVIEFDAGVGGAEGYDDPLTALGEPTRFTGEDFGFPGVVSPFNGPFEPDEIVSIGTGGWITLQFDTAVTDDPNNPFGIDLLVFGNSFFIDQNFPSGIVGGLFGPDGGTIELSEDGINWVQVMGVDADGMFPTLGYLDSGPYDDVRGSVPSNFTQPADPSVVLGDLIGLTYEELLDVYGGSGGGAGVDIGSVGLNEVSYVRISNSGELNVEIDAVSDVSPEVSTVIVCPEAARILRGIVLGGSSSALCDSDDSDWSFQPDALAATVVAPIEVEMDGTFPGGGTVARLRLRVEVAASDTGVVQRIDLFNFASGSYESVVFPNIPTTDTEFVVERTADAADFIGPQGEVRCRVSYLRPAGVPPFWSVGIDLVNWEVEL